MSSDNGVYIVKFPDGYRVAECQAIKNIDYYPKGSKERKEILKGYFGNSKIFKTKKEAMFEAFNMVTKNITDYGICYLGKYESFNPKPHIERDKGALKMRLQKREKEILRLRLGVTGKTHTLKEVGKIFDISRERVRQIQVEAMAKLMGKENRFKKSVPGDTILNY